MKKSKRFLAFLLTIAMVIAMLPVTVLGVAQNAAYSAIHIKGVEVTLANASAEIDFTATPNLTVEGARENTIILTLTREQMASNAPIVQATTTNPTTAVHGTYLHVPGGDDTPSGTNVSQGDHIATAMIATPGVEPSANSAATTALAPGDVIWINNGATHLGGFVRIEIRQAATGALTGETTVKNPVFDVLVPLNIDFALDPMQVGDGGDERNQIHSADYEVVNLSEFAVRASFTLDATKDAGLTLVESGVAAGQSSALKTGYFGILGAYDQLTAPPVFGQANGTYTFDSMTNDELNGTLVPFDWADATDGSADIAFILGAATGGDTLAAGNAGFSAFRIYGELNTLYVWEAADFSVAGVYNLTGILPTPYAAAASRTFGLNIEGPDVIPARFLASGSGSLPYSFSADNRTISYDLSKAANSSGVHEDGLRIFNFDAGDQEVIAIVASSFNNWFVPLADWRYDAANNRFYFSKRIVELWSNAQPQHFSFLFDIYLGDGTEEFEDDEEFWALYDEGRGPIASPEFFFRMTMIE